MTDSKIPQLLVTLYEQIREQQTSTNQVVLVTEALQRSMQELNPNFNRICAGHHLALLDGPIGQLQAEGLRQLDALIEQLRMEI